MWFGRPSLSYAVPRRKPPPHPGWHWCAGCDVTWFDSPDCFNCGKPADCSCV